MKPAARNLNDWSLVGLAKTYSSKLTATSEVMLLGKKLGLNPQQLADIINVSTGRCWASEVSPLTATAPGVDNMPGE
jgi:hypothetical protein